MDPQVSDIDRDAIIYISPPRIKSPAGFRFSLKPSLTYQAKDYEKKASPSGQRN